MNYFIVNQKDRMIWADWEEPIDCGCYNCSVRIYRYERRPRYPYSTELNWRDGQRVEEGKDFVFGLSQQPIDKFYECGATKIAIHVPSKKKILDIDADTKGVCYNCLNGFHEGCDDLSCSCRVNEHKTWWWKESPQSLASERLWYYWPQEWIDKIIAYCRDNKISPPELLKRASQPTPSKDKEEKTEMMFTLEEMIAAIFEGEVIGEITDVSRRVKARKRYFQKKFGIDISLLKNIKNTDSAVQG